MGLFPSKSTTEIVKQEQLEREKRRKRERATALSEYGILIPPSFAIRDDPNTQSTGMVHPVIRPLQAENLSSMIHPIGYVDSLRATDASFSILHHFLQPGLGFMARVVGSPASTVCVRVLPTLVASSSQSFTDEDDTGVSSGSSNGACLVGIERSWINTQTCQNYGMVQFRKDRHSELSAQWSPTPSASVFATLSPTGSASSGRVGALWGRRISLVSLTPNDEMEEKFPSSKKNPNNAMDVALGAWIPWIWSDTSTRKYAQAYGSSKAHGPSFLSPEEINGFAAISMMGSAAAMQAKLPVGHGASSPVTSSFFTTNLLDDNEEEPLYITIHQRSIFGPDAIDSRSSISVCQVLALDRYQLNPYESRAPFVRNSLAWTIQMESLSSTLPPTTYSRSSELAEDSGEHNPPSLVRTNRMSFGAVWQVNRVLAIKAVLRPGDQSWDATTAILLKRWQYPRLTCSIIHQWDDRRPRFVGIGLEIETESDDATSAKAGAAPDRPRSVPPTVAVLPKE